MRRRLATGLAIALACSVAVLPLAACGGNQLSEEELFEAEKREEPAPKREGVDLTSLATIADVQALDATANTSTYNEQHYVYVAYVDGAPIRAVADLTPEVYQQLNELDMASDDYQAKLDGLIGPLTLVTVEDLSVAIPKQEELDTLAGKTGQELLSEGYTFASLLAYGEGTETMAQMDKGLYRFNVTFNEPISGETAIDDASAIAGLTVKSVTFAELSDMAINPAG